MVQKLKGIEKYFLLMFLSLLTFWRGNAQAKSIQICCDNDEVDQQCCNTAGYRWDLSQEKCFES